MSNVKVLTQSKCLLDETHCFGWNGQVYLSYFKSNKYTLNKINLAWTVMIFILLSNANAFMKLVKKLWKNIKYLANVYRYLQIKVQKYQQNKYWNYKVQEGLRVKQCLKQNVSFFEF